MTVPTPALSARRFPARLAAALALLVVASMVRVPAADAQTPTRTATPVPTVTATPALVRVEVSPGAAKRKVGEFQNFSVTGFFSDGTTKNFTQKVVYSSTNLNAVYPPNTPGNAGRVEAVGVGIATIYATEPTTGINSQTTDDSAVMEVIAAPTPTPTSTNPTPTRTVTPKPTVTATPKLVSLALSPQTAKRKVGESQNFSVAGNYDNGQTKNLTQLVTYESSNQNVAFATNQEGNRGKVLAVGGGVATISATLAGISSNASGGSASLEVTVPPSPTATRTGSTPTPTLSPTPTVSPTPVLVSIALSPPTARRGIGTSQNFSARGFYSDGSDRNLTQRVDYFSTHPAIAEARNEAGNKGKVYAVGEGTATIFAVDPITNIATSGAGNATFEVFLAPTPTPTNTGVTPTRTQTPTPTPTATPKLLSLTISPQTVKKTVGQVQVFSVSGVYSDGGTKNLTQKVDYFSTNQGVAQTGTDPASKSKVLAVKVGVATISAKDPVTGIATSAAANATFTVAEAPSPTPTRTGPTSTAPSPTPTLTGSPTPSPTPILTQITLKPVTAQKGVGAFQNFTATGTFSDGSTKNVTQRVMYASTDETIAETPNQDGNRGRVNALKVGVVTISASDPDTGVDSADSNGSATFTVVAGSGSPNPRVTATPSLPIQTGNSSTACQRDVRRAARGFVDKKLKTLDRCSASASKCVQRKPGDASCLAGVRERCGVMLAKLADEEAKLIAAVIKRCAALGNGDLLGADGLAFGDIATSCAVRFGRTLTDLTSVAQCLAAQHSCRAEVLFGLERPRAGELLRLVDVPPDAGECRVDFGGDGVGLGDPKGAGKDLERCVQAIVRGAAGLARVRLASIGRCIDQVFVCVETEPGNGACLTKATQKCAREFTRIQREVGKLTVAAGKRCNGLDFALLQAAHGANLVAAAEDCPGYGIPAVGSVGDYVACLIRQHECEVADLVRFESPRGEALLDEIGRTLVDGICPEP